MAFTAVGPQYPLLDHMYLVGKKREMRFQEGAGYKEEKREKKREEAYLLLTVSSQG